MATERDDESDSLDEGEAGFARAPARGLLWWGRLDPEETEAAGWAREETRTFGRRKTTQRLFRSYEQTVISHITHASQMRLGVTKNEKASVVESVESRVVSRFP